MSWSPSVTVAAVIRRRDHYLMVEERPQGVAVINQPAGHLEDNESLLDAVMRECLEETAWHFQPQALVGIYRWRNDQNGDTYLRFTFSGNCLAQPEPRQLDADIVAAHWMTLDEIQSRSGLLRSPLVMRSIHDYLQGRCYPLDVLADLPTAESP